MLGAIVGDIVGSRFEFMSFKGMDFDLFNHKCFFTDDSVMTLAVAKAIMETEKAYPCLSAGKELDESYLQVLEKKTVGWMQKIGRLYPSCGFGGMFLKWIFSDDPKPYNSFGNGAAMRVSPAGFAARSEKEAVALAGAVTKTTHNHPEGLKGAEATAVAIYLARMREPKEKIKKKMEEYYDLDFTIEAIRRTYLFNESCQETVPQALECFLEAHSFENAIRLAISLGGDSDTLAAIAGGIAEAYYGVPGEIKGKALSYLEGYLLDVYREWEEFVKGIH